MTCLITVSGHGCERSPTSSRRGLGCTERRDFRVSAFPQHGMVIPGEGRTVGTMGEIRRGTSILLTTIEVIKRALPGL